MLLNITSYKSDSQGVTLIELLVAFVILTIIVSSVYVAFNSGKDSWQVGDIIIQRCQNARGVLDMMAREICSTVHIASSTYQIGLIYTSASEKLRFIVPIPGGQKDIWDLCEVWYRYDSTNEEIQRYIYDGNDGHLPISLDTLSGAGPSDSDYDTVVSNIKSLEFEFWDTSFQEHSEWTTSGTLPRAVKIIISVQDDKALRDPQEFTTVVYLSSSR